MVEEVQSIPIQLLDLMGYMSRLQLEDDYLDIYVVVIVWIEIRYS